MFVKEIVLDNEKRCVLAVKNDLEREKLLVIDSTLALSIDHLAKAVEVMLHESKSGKTLRKLKYEFYRRLLSIKEFKKIPLNKIEKENCNVYVLSCEELYNLNTFELRECDYDKEKVLSILRSFGVEPKLTDDRVEKYLIAFIEASKINKWLID